MGFIVQSKLVPSRRPSLCCCERFSLNEIEVNSAQLPGHVALIPDGNGRWAEGRGLSRPEGHSAGSRTLEKVVNLCMRLEIPQVTVFVCSTENMNRSPKEISVLMELISEVVQILEEKPLVRLKWIGSSVHIPEFLRKRLDIVTKLTSKDKNPHEYRLQLTMAIDYGGRAEIADTARRLAVDVREGKLDAEAVDERMFDEYLRSESVGDPDLIIRTGGQKRLSNFLLWQSAYSEMYFSDILWPDFDEKEVAEAFRWFATRKRNYGLVK
ncbi:hypothetical protein NDN08_000891 [Rhodosorus marinus]|uniref:Alkyl transferase n=1 Tax=Rhodosorus marinus TaxID=101924 RepID=A0AAV8UTF7_9RHOD|nr:hypothetical protein NDN08_000891 [Rhodosorus marinus]